MQASAFLSFPLELRTKIYEELLCPNPTRIKTLYHDTKGRSIPLNLHPSILRVNRQIYFEANSLLYDNNIFELNLESIVRRSQQSNYYDNEPDPPPLFITGTFQSSNTQPFFRDANHTGIMSPQVFQRLRRITLVTRKMAIWGLCQENGRHFSCIGGLIMDILQLLSVEERTSTPSKKTFDFLVRPDWMTKYGIFQTEPSDAFDGRVIGVMVPLLKDIKKSRATVVEEIIRPYDSEKETYHSLKRVNVDIDALMLFTRLE